MKSTLKNISSILLPLLISSFSWANEPIIEAHLSKLLGAKDYTLEVAEAMPESLFSYKPTEEEMSFGEQLVHIADNLIWLSSNYIGENPSAERKKLDANMLSKEEIIKIVGDAYDFAIHQISSQTADTLTKEFDWRGGKFNKIQFLNLIQDHQTHHRAQLVVYLRLNQIKPPAYRGW